MVEMGDDNGRSSRSPRELGKKPGHLSAAEENARALRAVLLDMEVVTKKDMVGLNARLDTIDERLVSNDKRTGDMEQKYLELADAMRAVQHELAQLQQSRPVVSVGGAASSCGSTAATRHWAPESVAGSEEWQPRGVIVRGWAPFGCPAKQRIDDGRAKELTRQLLDLLPDSLRAQCKPAVPYATNHQIFLSIHGAFGSCRLLADTLNAKIMEKGIRVNGNDIKALVETSPSRKGQCKLFFDAVEQLGRLNVAADRYKVCPKGLRIYDSATFELVGSPKDGRWIWFDTVDAMAGRPIKEALGDTSMG